MKENEPTPEMLAHIELKGKIVKLMQDFFNQYSGKDNPNSLSPKTGYILVDVLTSCLSEAQYQVKDYQPFTPKQKERICYLIDQCYLMMKPLLEGQVKKRKAMIWRDE